MMQVEDDGECLSWGLVAWLGFSWTFSGLSHRRFVASLRLAICGRLVSSLLREVAWLTEGA